MKNSYDALATATQVALAVLVFFLMAGGSGHYMPGSMALFGDAVPPEEAFIVRCNRAYYEGDYRRGCPVDIARTLSAFLGLKPPADACGITHGDVFE
jgi:hypothetical protein